MAVAWHFVCTLDATEDVLIRLLVLLDDVVASLLDVFTKHSLQSALSKLVILCCLFISAATYTRLSVTWYRLVVSERFFFN